MSRSSRSPRCIVIAGPNGAGKTTFAREFLPREAGVIHFVNADLIASGLSPLRPELAARQGGRLVLSELNRLVEAREDFAFESTLSGRTYLPMMRRWKVGGYRIELVFLSLPSVELACSALRHVFVKGGTTYRGPMLYVDSTAVGKTFRRCIVSWQIGGRSTIMQEILRDCWRLAHEETKCQSRIQAVREERRTGIAAGRQGRP